MSQNAFVTGQRISIPATLIYARNQGRVLMVDHRKSGKWNGLGGKLEADESPWQGARREFQEECGLLLPESAFQCLGWLQFPNFKASLRQDWICFVFTVEVSDEDARRVQAGQEGALTWGPEAELLQLPLWPGDRLFLPRVLRREPFQGTLWYEAGQVLRHHLVP